MFGRTMLYDDHYEKSDFEQEFVKIWLYIFHHRRLFYFRWPENQKTLQNVDRPVEAQKVLVRGPCRLQGPNRPIDLNLKQSWIPKWTSKNWNMDVWKMWAPTLDWRSRSLRWSIRGCGREARGQMGPGRRRWWWQVKRTCFVDFTLHYFIDWT